MPDLTLTTLDADWQAQNTAMPDPFNPGAMFLERWLDSSLLAELRDYTPPPTPPGGSKPIDRAAYEVDIRACLATSAEQGCPVIGQEGEVVIGADFGSGDERAAWTLMRCEPDGRLTVIDSGVGDFPAGVS